MVIKKFFATDNTPFGDEQLRKDFKRIMEEKKWRELIEFLQTEHSEGKTEFRIAFQSQDHFIIHPLGKDGKTLDIHL